jgi:hypothetical protein
MNCIWLAGSSTEAEYTYRSMKNSARMYGNPINFFPAKAFLRNVHNAREMARKTTRKTTSEAKNTCDSVVANAPGQLEMLLPPLLLPPPPRLGAMSVDSGSCGRSDCDDEFGSVLLNGRWIDAVVKRERTAKAFTLSHSSPMQNRR